MGERLNKFKVGDYVMIKGKWHIAQIVGVDERESNWLNVNAPTRYFYSVKVKLWKSGRNADDVEGYYRENELELLNASNMRKRIKMVEKELNRANLGLGNLETLADQLGFYDEI